MVAARVAILSVLGVAFPTFLHAVKSSVHSETSQCHVLVVLSNLDLLHLLTTHERCSPVRVMECQQEESVTRIANCEQWLAKVDLILEHRNSFYFHQIIGGHRLRSYCNSSHTESFLINALPSSIGMAKVCKLTDST